LVELEVARVHHDAFRRLQRDADRIRDAVVRPEEGGPDRTELDDGIAVDQVALRLVQQSGFLQLVLDQAEGQLRGVDRHVQVLEDIRQASDVVLVSVSYQNSPYFVSIFQQIRNIRDDDIDTEHFFLGEFQTGVDDHDVVAVLHDIHVLADLAQSAQREDRQNIAILFCQMRSYLPKGLKTQVRTRSLETHYT